VKKLVIVGLVAVLLALAIAPSIALAKAKTGDAGKSNVAHLLLFEKDPVSFEIIDGGAWGKMTYNQSGSELCLNFNGHGLEAGTDYTLIYYPDPWPGNGLICLGSGTANNGGQVHIKSCTDTGDLPICCDPMITSDLRGAKIWLVQSADVDCTKAKMIGWNPTEYLFEYDLITFDDTDVATLCLYEKDANWDIVPGGACGTMVYNESGDMLDLDLSACGLQAGKDYTLIYYPDPWPGNGLMCLGSETADAAGCLTIDPGPQNTGDLPIAGDTNPGAKIWLVLSADVDCPNAKMIGWNQSDYLYEYDLITFDDTDVP
jgi:hypothetical protein